MSVFPTANEEDAGKLEPSSVNYRRGTVAGNRCGTCRYSYNPYEERRCRIIKGKIFRDDTCDRWEKKRLP